MGNYSKRLVRLSTKGPDIGYCAICGKHGRLTKDHVPPAQCNNQERNILRTIAQTYPSSTNSRYQQSQGGTHFKTLCGKCNSSLLGTLYDPELITLTKEITRLYLAAAQARLIIPGNHYLFIKPQKIARSVVGHLLAAHAIEQVRDGVIDAPFPNALRKYFLNGNEPLPQEVDIYYWFYPCKKQVIMKNVGVIPSFGSDSLIGHVLKYMPLAFWVLWQAPEARTNILPKLVSHKDMGIDEISQINVDFVNIPSLGFPETPTDNGAVMFRDETTSVSTNAK